jgi:hypothetical protein
MTYMVGEAPGKTKRIACIFRQRKDHYQKDRVDKERIITKVYQLDKKGKTVSTLGVKPKFIIYLPKN